MTTQYRTGHELPASVAKETIRGWLIAVALIVAHAPLELSTEALENGKVVREECIN